MPWEYECDLKKLKNLIRTELDKIIGCYGKDSTSAITYNLHYPDKSKVKFKFDVGIIKQNRNRNYCRLINDKTNLFLNIEHYIWNEIPKSYNIDDKISRIKHNGYWLDVRELYLDKKNLYLSRQDKSHPSFIVYVETINEVYNMI